MKKFGVVLLFMFISIQVFSAEQDTIIPMYQGIWNCQIISKDKGVTKIDGKNTYYATVYASTVRTMDGDILTVKKIKEFQSGDVVYTCIFFEGADDGYFWVVSKLEYDLILLQQMKDFKEVMRVVFTVTK